MIDGRKNFIGSKNPLELNQNLADFLGEGDNKTDWRFSADRLQQANSTIQKLSLMIPKDTAVQQVEDAEA